MAHSFPAWWRENRTSARAAFALRAVSMVVGGALGLVWMRILLHALGPEKYGTYLSFLAYLGIATAGELGMGAAVAIRTTQLLARGDFDELRRVHGTARRAFVLVAGACALVALLVSAWLPLWLRFTATAQTGALGPLFALGAVNIAIAIYGSYLNNSAYAAGTVMWPIVPNFLFTQLLAFVQIAVALTGQPLWVLHAAGLCVNLGMLWLSWTIYRHSHGVFAERLPPSPERRDWYQLAGNSGWSYLFSLAALVYISIDRLLINAYFGAPSVTLYHLNGKLCELATSLTITASGVAMPMLIQRVLSAAAETRQMGERDALKLARLQNFLSLICALGYLWINDLFIAHFFGGNLAPLALEGAFAMSLVLAANLDLYLQLAGRLDDSGMRAAAQGIALSALGNFVLSFIAARWLHWLPGVVWATCLVQALLLLAMAAYVQRRHRIIPVSLPRVWGVSLFLPVGTVAAAIAWRAGRSPQTPLDLLAVGGAYAAGLLLYSIALGPTPPELFAEAKLILRRFGLFANRGAAS
jgi:O-antigen/teichoic acid export membrane protein